ncbi:MAG: glutamate synthase large subunit, partial [Elusimicrobia bacterium]|nr:glutamate synthase large subunit [Elusimicrobiota bacterium]
VKDGITVLKNLVHRGALGGDLKTGDGAGMLLRIPHLFFCAEALKKGFSLPEKGHYGIAFIFMPRSTTARTKLEKSIQKIIKTESGRILFWRDVPVRAGSLGKIAKDSMPFMRQLFVSFEDLCGDELESRLYIVRRRIEKEALKKGFSISDFYISSFSARTIVYKGMFAAPQFENFYPDLKDKKFKSAFALVHQRYSTNTFPSWALAHPFRNIAHNGEINTINGNVNYMRAREATLSSPLFGKDIKKIFPVVTEGASDSAIFDNTLELLVSAGRSVEHAMIMMVPEAFGEKYHISEDKRSFYEYHSAFMEPWDGPAAIVFTDGIKIGAALDRNGLRPLRYVITKSGKVIAASEAGVLDTAPDDVLEKGRLGPGKMIVVDTAEGRVKKDNEIKSAVSRRKLYRRWLEKNRIELKGLFQPASEVEVEHESLAVRQKIFGYNFEDLNLIISPMAENAQEPIGSMGNDEAPAVLSKRPQLLFKYFKQLFAQVTNPPIDPYRENLVMSLMSFIGRERNLLGESPRHCRQLKLSHPVLTNGGIEKLKGANIKDFNSAVVPMLFDPAKGPGELARAVHVLCIEVEKKTDQGCSLVIISDRGVDAKHAPIPSLLAVSSVSRHLVSHGKRHLIGLVVETGEVREVTDFAALIAFGASAVNPYLAFEILAAMKKDNSLPGELKMEDAMDNYITAVKKGLLKIMSKMGVSTIRSYKGAEMFEAIGLNSKFINKYFGGVPSRIEGIGIEEIAAETLKRHFEAFAPPENGSHMLPSGGHYSYRRFSEKHLMTPEVIVSLQKAVREGDYGLYKKYAELINEQSRNLCTLRGLFRFRKGRSVPLDEVESADSIVKRFVTSAMSFGSISKEAHETMAIAMNRLGGASNSGEGGEDKLRFEREVSGDSKISAVKQVASGRFGVSINYLVHAKELQIKMAQGAKPGEGGQLPGHKVNKIIADIRYSTPGVMLISPPPHHDIYSIEDLAQLIFDLKNANSKARISVKLTSEAGVGTVAAGVAKGKADMVLISGGDGGTGASPLSSIKHAGIPWEIGLAETQQTLVLNKLRDRIRVQVDGQMRTGRD